MDYKYTGIILNKKNVAETDRIYTIYTQEAGKIRVLGKGVRRPNAKLAGNLESLTMAEIFVAKSRGIGKITGAIVLDNFLGTKSNLDALGRVGDIFKIFGKIMAEQEKDEQIFEILAGFLTSMDKLSAEETSGRKMDILSLGFLFKLLGEMGYRLEVGKCVNCGAKLQPENNYFSPAKGGVLCERCHTVENKRLKISTESIKLVRIFMKNKIENLAKLQVSQKDVNNLKVIVQESINWL
ncbi:MAG: DNA repair protein RecO [Parcubacteria group bacterium]|jgi:DNA repair protein RecO (recombination protein O)